MARIRSIKPDFFKSEDVSTLPLRARLTWIGLWTQCDDHGRYKGSAKILKGDLWSLDDVSLRDIEDDLEELARSGRIVRYLAGGKQYLAVVNWHVHQAINRPSKPKYPAPPAPMASPDQCVLCAAISPNGSAPAAEVPGSGVVEPRGTVHPTITDDSLNTHGALTPGREGKGREGKGGDARASANPPPPANTTSGPPTPEPPRKCLDHLDDPDPPSCGRCADARRTHAAWTRDQVHADQTARSAAAQAHAAAVQAAIDACPQCNDCGYHAGGLCTHDPNLPARATRGAALARAAIRRPPTNLEEIPDVA